MGSYSPELIEAAKRCLEHQIKRWEAEREIENLVGCEIDDMETPIKNHSVCVDLDEHGLASEQAAIQLLDSFELD